MIKLARRAPIDRGRSHDRYQTGSILRLVRQLYWNFPRQFPTHRGLDDVRRHGLDLAGFLRQHFPKQPIFFFDCGAGIGQLGRDLRNALGNQIHLTGIGLNYPARTRAQWEKMERAFLQTARNEKTLAQFREWKKQMLAAEQNVKAYDEFFSATRNAFPHGTASTSFSTRWAPSPTRTTGKRWPN